jgi:hypothetical protein
VKWTDRRIHVKNGDKVEVATGKRNNVPTLESFEAWEVTEVDLSVPQLVGLWAA